MRVFLLLGATLITIAATSCHKEFTCKCSGHNAKGEIVTFEDDFKLAGEKDAQRWCDSTQLNFKKMNPGISGERCDLK